MNKTKINLSEKDFSKTVENLLDIYKWHWYHCRPGLMQSGKWATPLSGYKGFPDYIAVKGSRMLFLELKSDKGILSPEQKEWIGKLKAVTGDIDVYVWKPKDYEEILEVLQ